MADAYVIEVDDETVGIVVRELGERGFRFHPAQQSVYRLDGRVFDSPGAAETAARLLVANFGRSARTVKI